MIKKSHIFISYARADGSDFAQRLYDDLEVRSINAWLDVHDIDPGEDWDQAIDNGLRDATALAVVLTPGAVVSPQVRSEWNAALNMFLPVIPLLVINCEVPRLLTAYNWIDFRAEYDAGIAALRRRIKRLPKDHLAYLKEELDEHRTAQTASPEPHRFQLKIDDLTTAIARWEQRFESKRQSAPSPQPIVEIKEKEDQKSMTRVFVGREPELARLSSYLDKSLKGETQVCFVVGDAGTGKTILINEFAYRVQDADPNLLIVSGNCNDITGKSDPYLPFRHVLGMLTGDEQRLAAGAITDKNAERLKGILKTSGRTLVEIAPELVGTLIPGAGILVSLARLGAKERGLLKGLEEQAKRAEKHDTDIEQSEIFFQYTALLDAISKDHPLVIILDDLQWADTASIGLFFHLARELRKARTLLVGIYRPSEVTPGREGDRHPLEKVLNEVRRYWGDVWIDLNETTQSGGRAFIDAFIDSELNSMDENFRAALFQHTGGHALFTVELLREMQDRGNIVKDSEGRWQANETLDWNKLPAKVEAVIEERIERLEEELREVLTVASVEGQDFTAQVVARVQEMKERDALKTLSRELEKRHRLVHENGEFKTGNLILSRFTFSHALFQHYLYNSLGAGERRVLHSEVAKILEDLYTGSTDEIAIQLAHHYIEAGETEKALAYLKRAGQKALEMVALNESIALFQQAISLVENTHIDSSPVHLMELRHLLGSAYDGTGQYSVALNQYTTSWELAKDLNDIRKITENLICMGRCCWQLRNYEMAMDHLNPALALARELDDPLLICRAIRNLGVTYGRLCDFDKAIEYNEEAYRVATKLESPLDRGSALNNLGTYYSNVYGNFEKGIETYQRALNITVHQTGQVLYHSNIANSYLKLGNFAQSKLHVSRAIEIAKRIGSISREAEAYKLFASITLFNEQRVDEAVEQFNKAISLCASIDRYITIVEGKCLLTLCYLYLNAHQDALSSVIQADQYAQQHNASQRGHVFNETIMHSVVLMRAGSLTEVGNILHKEIERLERIMDEPHWGNKYQYALALSSLAVLEADQTQADHSLEAYRKAVGYCGAKGILIEALFVLRELRKVDTNHVLRPVEDFLIEAEAKA